MIKELIKIYEELDTHKYFYIFMELIEGGSLKDLIINRYKNPNTNYLFRDSEWAEIKKGLLGKTPKLRSFQRCIYISLYIFLFGGWIRSKKWKFI